MINWKLDPRFGRQSLCWPDIFGLIGLVLCLLVTAIGLKGCKKSPQPQSGGLFEGDSGIREMMGTFVRIRLRCETEKSGREAFDAAFEALEQVDRLMSTYREDSELSQVNIWAAQKPVEVSPETFALLQRALEYSRMTEGAFDITVAPLVDFWKKCADEDRLPNESELAAMREQIGYDKLILAEDRKTVSFAVEGMELSVDAIAKGYAVDQALAALRRPGVLSALVDIGGEIACFGRNRPGQDWIVGIQDLFVEDNDNPLSQNPRWKVGLRDNAIATSGNYRQYVSVAGQKYSHIIDPRTGRPADKLPSVTIIAGQCEEADVLATAISVLGPEKGLHLVEKQADIEAFLVTGTDENPIIHRSSGFDKFEIK